MKFKFALSFALVVLLSFPRIVCADDIDAFEMNAKAEFERATSDIAYYNDIWKALYFQNMEMISLLKDIRQEMKLISENNKKLQKAQPTN